ncbi:hypothetical protein [Caulobacter hibisci]|uniref:Uncharacterized protein n=1 Tax=Caulobacter hibisci TaxID=2035993 RepID=A0ABS0T0N1_9CAUL|nr:hypothetical protein [Caulobacter hibisci]MBI1685244.1 hypothetical protein [Caulobacter hibisci]
MLDPIPAADAAGPMIERLRGKALMLSERAAVVGERQADLYRWMASSCLIQADVLEAIDGSDAQAGSEPDPNDDPAPRPAKAA